MFSFLKKAKDDKNQTPILKISKKKIGSIKVLGAGCKKCHELYDNVFKALDDLNLQAEVEMITDFEIMVSKYGAISLPGLVLNEDLICSGKTLSVEQVKTLLKENEKLWQ